MLSTILAATLLTQGVPTVRLLETLPNGARVWAESIPQAKQCSVYLWLGNPAIKETPATHGMRHMLEHLIAKGPSGRLDQALESKGIMMLADTSRDAICFRVECPPEQLDFVVSTSFTITQPPKLDQESIKREAITIRDELAGLGNHRLLAMAMWSQALGEKGLDPFGNVDLLQSFTPESLKNLHTALTQPKSVLFTISGPQTVSILTAKAKELVSALRESKVEIKPNQANAQTEKQAIWEPGGFSGSAIGLPSEGIYSRKTLANLAIALSLSQSGEGYEVTYSPSVNPGLIVISSSGRKAYEGVQNLSDRGLLLGKLFLQTYLRQTQVSTSRLCAFRGAILSQGGSVNLSDLERVAESLTLEELRAAKQAAREAPIVEGL